MDDSVMYTGIDEPKGLFGNENENEETKRLIDDQKKQLQDLTPKLEGLIDMIDAEIKSVMSVDRFLTAAKDSEDNIRAELQASALYKAYLDNLKTKFILALNETKKGK